MATPKKLQKQRRQRARERAQMENLQRGATEKAAQQAADGTTPDTDPNDPNNVVMSKGQTTEVRVVSKEEQAERRTQSGTVRTASPGGGTVRSTTARTKPTVVPRRNKSAEVKVVSRNAQRGGSTAVVRGARDAAGQRLSVGNNTRVVRTPQSSQSVQEGQAAPQEIAPPVPNAPTTAMSQGHNAPEVDVTVILTCYERPGFLRRQLQALQGQSVRPRVMMAWVNTGEVRHDEQALNGSGLTIIRANANLGPWMRFTLAAEAVTKYVCILDDDTLPGPRWIEACVNRLEEAEEAAAADPDHDPDEDLGTYCIAAVGQIFRTDHPLDTYLVGPQSPRDEELEVDVGRQGWFFRRDLAHVFANRPRPIMGPLGWDLHFAAAVQEEGVLTICLPYPPGNQEAWGAKEPASTERSLTESLKAAAAEGRGPDANVIRSELYGAYRNEGWAPLIVLDAEDAEQGDEEEAPSPAPAVAGAAPGQ